MEYQPERYMKDGKPNLDVRDPGTVAFGFGRRFVDPTYSPRYALKEHWHHLPQYLSWQILKRQLGILNCTLCSRSL